MAGYKSKMVEPISLPARERRERNLERARYNVFNLPADEVFIDLLTDSGTGAMSDAQWAALLRGDEAYAGSRSFDRLESAVRDVMGVEHVVPTHQGRGAENVLYGTLLSDAEDAVVPNNTHFDTTRAHVANQGAEPVDCPVDGAHDPDLEAPFKGNFSLERARALVDEVGADRIPLVIQTITNNSAAGQPVSVANTRRVRDFADEIDATFVIDACRFAENAYFVQQREDEFAAETEIAEIAREQLGYADAVVMSGKKDGLVNTGGFVATDDEELFERCKQRAILYEGFPTYGGMAGRDLEAMAVGLREAVERSYVADRVEQVRTLGSLLRDAGVPIYEPVGGHAVYLDAAAALPHLEADAFPGQALVCELYREGGVRGVELGSFAFPDAERPELVRLAVPRRTYHREHFDHVAETAATVLEKGRDVDGLEIATEPEMPELRHFTAGLEPRSEER
ncbi:tryptophanase [Halopiger xanaduensis]|uniref:Tryptophanase n=1 Tax=Halopiger xanaduensis (strain DSM 18323 / JCM 14033 / SH-6) TaxID=797210 RepID=F8DCL8_HALXS|nr:tryptophanase [Halopiger xanaduensis]AEH36062.1 Tryptophanase [Halopiger xanaduensis SH-6]